MNDVADIFRNLQPLMLVTGGIAFGIAAEKIVVLKLRRMASRTQWEYDDILISSLRGMASVGFAIAGCYAAVISAPLSEKTASPLKTTLIVAAISLGTIVAGKVVSGFILIYARNRVLPSSSIFVHLARILIFLLGFLIILQTLGISITPLITALGIGGLAVALAMQDTLSNLFSGLQIIATQQIQPGDYIRLGTGEEGYIVDINWRNTVIRTLPNSLIIVPNSKLATSIVVNYNLPEPENAVLVEVAVSYGSDLEKVEKVTVEVGAAVMHEVHGSIPEFQPFIRYHTFSDFSIKFTVILRGKEYVDQYLIKHEFVKRLHKRYQQEQIEIPFPITTVILKDFKGRPSVRSEALNA